MSNVGEFIKIKREEAGYSQEKLAKACGLKHDSTMCNIENGKRKVTWEELGKLSKELGNFHIFEALEAAGYITKDDFNPVFTIHHLEKLNEIELQEVRNFVSYLIYRKEMNREGSQENEI